MTAMQAMKICGTNNIQSYRHLQTISTLTRELNCMLLLACKNLTLFVNC
jgi:hypothetical protein